MATQTGCSSPAERVARLRPDGAASSVRCEEDRALVSSDWPRGRTQEGGCKEGGGSGGAGVVREGSGEGGGGVTEQRGGGGERRRVDRDGGGQRGWRGSERGGDEGGGEDGLHQLLLRRQGEETRKQESGIFITSNE